MAEKWVVKAVPSGDTLTLFQPDPKTVPPAEKTIVLSGLSCPKVARVQGRDGVQPDDEFGWQAREYVRKKVIGRMVMFTKETTNETTGREYGQVLFKETQDGPPKNLALALVASGLCPMRDQVKGAFAQQLAEAEKAAVVEKRGRYADDAREIGRPRRLLLDPPSTEMMADIVKRKGQKVKAIVDYVVSGHMLKVLMTDTMQLALVHMSGINTANERKLKDKPEELASSKAVEARCLAERLLLNREVTLTIEGKDKYDNILCSVTAGPNVFQEELLKQGYAKIFDPTVSESTFRDRLRAAQGQAQQGRRGVWKDWVPPIVSEKGAKEAKEGEQVPLLADFTGTVLQVVTGDTVVVRNPATKEKLKLTLASVRAGAEKIGEAGQSRIAKIERQVGDRFGYADGEGLILFHNLFWESREYMRKLLVGKEVKVQVDYMMKFPTQDGGTEVRPAVTVLYDGEKNAAEALVKMGFGIVIGSRDGVSRYMDKLRDCQADAQAAKLGGWSPKQLVTHKVREMARPQAKTGTALLGGLQRAGAGGQGVPKLKCVVEFVLAPNRVKLYVEREKCQVSLNMAGIAVPSMGMGTEDPDPLAPEVLAFTEQHLMQRDVEVSFEAFHGGSFIGNLYLGGKSFACTLLADGYATTEGQNLQSMVGKSEATEAQDKAKAGKKGIWHPTAGMPKRVQQAQARSSGWERASLTVSDSKAEEPVTVSEVVDAGHFWYQAGNRERDLRIVEELLHKVKPADKAHPSEAKRDDIVAARFSADKVWYRARVIRNIGQHKVEVHFIDYGNKEVTSLKELRKIDEVAASIKSAPAIAQEGFVAFIEPPSTDADYGSEAAIVLREYTQSPCSLVHEYTDPRGSRYFTLSAPGSPTFQEEILTRGYAYVKRELESNAALKDRLAEPLKAQERAKRSHTALWRHGDPRDDDAH